MNPFKEFDYIYIDWYNSTADIRQNAYLLIDIIEYINNIKTTSEPLVIMGQSMGGLVTRYALRFMELANKPHYVSTFISHDVPHLGANVPLGLIYCFHQLICCLNENDHFPFFDLDIFCNAVRVGLIMNGNNSAVISNYEMVLLNTNEELIQEVPFAVLCKPVFPEPLTPPIQLNPIVD